MTKNERKNLTFPEGFEPIVDYHSPLDYKKLMNTLQCFSERYPFLSITYMGTSVLGRGIPMVTLGEEGRRRKAVMYVGCHHGMEWLTSIVLLRFINEYCEAYKDSRRICGISIKNLFRSRTIYVIPQFNVDGADIQINGADGNLLKERLISMNEGEDFTHWQANARGVDLNHNYDAGFYEYKRIEEKLGICGGAPTRFAGEIPESEPETASLCSMLRFSSEIGLIMTLHTQGEKIYYAGQNCYVPRSAAIAKLLSGMTGYALSKPEGPAAYGGLTDWCTKELRRPSFTIECGKGTNPLPLEDYQDIYERMREALFSAPLLI